MYAVCWILSWSVSSNAGLFFRGEKIAGRRIVLGLALVWLWFGLGLGLGFGFGVGLPASG